MTGSRPDNAGSVRHATLLANGHPFHIIEQGEGPAVLFCHGFPDTAETWRSQMRAVAEAGYRAITLDMRGFGDSYAPDDFRLYTSLHITADLIGILDALKIETAVLVGHDWGADYAQRACVMRPDRFRGLASISIPFAPRGEKSLWDDLQSRGLSERYYALDLVPADADKRLEPASDTIRSALYWLSASPPSEALWDPLDHERGMLRPPPASLPDWAPPEYVDHNIRSFERTGFHGGLNYYRVLQVTFDLTAPFKDVLIHQPSIYIWGGADGLCRFFHPEPPSVDDLRPVWPGLTRVVKLDDVGHWPQHEAAGQVDAELVRFLSTIDDGVWKHGGGTMLDQRTAEGFTPLMVAAGLGQRQTIETLLSAGADPLAMEPKMGATALHKAAQSGNPDVIGLLLDHGAFIDHQSPVLGNTPLIDAVLHKQADAVRLLLDRGARTAIRNHWQQSALELARDDGLDIIAQMIEAKNATDAEKLAGIPLIVATKGGDVEAVRRLIADGADIEARAPIVGGVDDDYTPLGIAVRERRPDIVAALLDAGADPRGIIGLMHGTSVHEASFLGFADILQLFWEQRGTGEAALSLDAQGPYNGLTPLHDAVWHGHIEAARLLVEMGAPLDIRTHAGLTPRELARLYGYDELAELLANAEQD